MKKIYIIFLLVQDCTFFLFLLSWILLHSGRYFLRFACRQYCPRYFGIPLCFSLRKIRSAQIKRERKYQRKRKISATDQNLYGFQCAKLLVITTAILLLKSNNSMSNSSNFVALCPVGALLPQGSRNKPLACMRKSAQCSGSCLSVAQNCRILNEDFLKPVLKNRAKNPSNSKLQR